MWLDGLYMGQPFYAEYAYRNNRVNDYADIINQFVTVARHNYDPKTDLYRHACDVSKREKWADKTDRIVTTLLGTRHGMVCNGLCGCT